MCTAHLSCFQLLSFGLAQEALATDMLSSGHGAASCPPLSFAAELVRKLRGEHLGVRPPSHRRQNADVALASRVDLLVILCIFDSPGVSQVPVSYRMCLRPRLATWWFKRQETRQLVSTTSSSESGLRKPSSVRSLHCVSPVMLDQKNVHRPGLHSLAVRNH